MNLTINNTEYIMTLKEVTDLIGVQHSKAMAKIEELQSEDGFGSLSKMDIDLFKATGERNGTIQTYNLTKKQAIAVGARLSPSLLMKVINKLEELENKTKPRELSPQEFMAKALQISAITIAEAEERAKRLEFANEKLYEKVEEARDEIIARDEVIEHISDRSMDVKIGAWAKMFHDLKGIPVGQNRLFKALRELGYLSYDNMPKQVYVQQKLFSVKSTSYKNTRGEDVATYTPRVTHKGIDKLTDIAVEHIREMYV